MESEDYSTWTSCQMYGHNFQREEEDTQHVYHCTDCGEMEVREGDK
jgi:hypothetical protein